MCFESTVTSPLCESNKASLGTQPTQWLCSATILQSVCNACELSCFSCVRLWATLWTVACQAPLSMGFSRQEHWSGLPFPRPADLPDPGIEPVSPASPASSGRLSTTEPPGKPVVRGGECFTYFLTLVPKSPFKPKSCIFFSSFF